MVKSPSVIQRAKFEILPSTSFSLYEYVCLFLFIYFLPSFNLSTLKPYGLPGAATLDEPKVRTVHRVRNCSVPAISGQS